MQHLIQQFEQTFNDSADCYRFLYELKWAEGFKCPRCAHNKCYTIETREQPLYECRSCAHQTSLTSGTVMEKSRTSLYKWMLALFLFTHPLVEGVNASRLAECLQVTYKTAWSMLSKIRRALSQLDNAMPLDGNVDVIVTAYCRPLIGSLLPHPKETPVIIGANLEPDTGETSSIKMKIADPSMLRSSNSNFLYPEGEKLFSARNIKERARVTFIRQPINHRTKCNALRLLAKHARKWIAQVYRGISGPYLQFYLDEFSFRYNHFMSRNLAGVALNRLCQACVQFPGSLMAPSHST